MKELSKLRKGLESAVEPGNAWLVNAVFDLLEWQVKRCDQLEKENERLRERIAQLEGSDDPPPPAESYSLDAEDKPTAEAAQEETGFQAQAGKKAKEGQTGLRSLGRRAAARHHQAGVRHL